MENRNPKTFKDYADKFIKSRKFRVAPSTLVNNKCKASALKRHFGETLISDICHSDILDLFDDLHERYANKTINEFMTVLRGTFKHAVNDGAIGVSPMLDVKNFKACKVEPKPFSKSELNRLHSTKGCRHGKHALMLNVLTGVRISELIALTWEDIDFKRKEMFVRRAKVLNDYKTPKTEESTRKVELNELAIQVLKKQLKLTGDKATCEISVLQSDSKSRVKEHLQFVFYNSQTDAPFIHAAQFNKTFFKPFLEKAGVAHRGAGQLRHTFASQNLTAGISKEWIARQMGHSDTAMVDKHYGKWITVDSPDYASASARNLSSTFEMKVSEPVPVTEIPSEFVALIQALQAKPELLTLVQTIAGSQL